MQSEAQLNTLISLAQDFPKLAHDLVTNWVPEVDSQIHDALESNRQSIVEGGRNLIWLNGMAVSDKEMEPLRLVSQSIKIDYF